MKNYREILTGLFAQAELMRKERPSAGTRFRMMGLVADVREVVFTLREEVLARVSREAVLDADQDVDYAALSEQVLAMELVEEAGADADLLEQIRMVNDALGELSSVLAEIAEELERRHSAEEYESLYEAELKRYHASGAARRARKNYEKWKENECYGEPSLDDLDGYRLCRLVRMFEKGVFDAKVSKNQRTKRYPDEVDFSQIDDEHPLKKTAYKHYAALRRLVDYQDGFLTVNRVHVGQHFFVCRHEENAKVNRSNFLKYMLKISLAQEDYKRLSAARQEPVEQTANALPDVLGGTLAVKYWERLQEAGFVDAHHQLLPGITRKQAMYIADLFSDRLQMRSKWKPFQDLWHLNNLAQEKWDMQQTGTLPARCREMDAVFSD